MPYRYLLLMILCGNSFFVSSQNETSVAAPAKKKLTFYASWGYSRWAFTKSTIHFKNKGEANYTDPTHGPYDFTLYNAVAHDSPDFNHIASSWSDLVNITIPQFNARIGFYFNNKRDEGWEINYDHAKYVVTDGQTVHVKGVILGEQVDKDTLLQRPNFHFEHTDGANFWQINYIKRWKLFTGKDGTTNIGWIFKPGAGVVIPRTDVQIFGSRLNNRWHLAGFIAGIETGFRAEVFRHLCIEWTAKAAYADYLWCVVHYIGHGQANHRFGTVGSILTVGYRFAGKKS